MDNLELERPGGKMASRPLHLIWLTDCSSSMSVDGKIQALNEGVRETIPHLIEAAEENPQAEVLVRSITFSNHAEWHISQPTPVKEFSWQDVSTNGRTAMGEALTLVVEQLKMPPMTNRALPPVLILITDGYPTDDFDRGLKNLLSQPWGLKAVRLAIPIGDDTNMDVLRRFIANPEIEPIAVKNAWQLKEQLRFLSTVAISSVASSHSTTDSNTGANVVIPKHHQVLAGNIPSLAEDVW